VQLTESDGRMSQIQTHCRVDETCLSFKPGNARLKPVNFKVNKGLDHQPNMVSLNDFEPILTPFNTLKPFDTSMVNLNLPEIQGVEGCSRVMYKRLFAQYFG
jgi:hypothetical protein